MVTTPETVRAEVNGVDQTAPPVVERAPSPSPVVVHIRQLTGIRALAALWVLTFHFRPFLLAAFPFLWPLVPMFNVGYLGVDLFFVLSGFILTYTHLERMSDNWAPRKVLGFLWLRLSRIWPLLFFMMLVWGLYISTLLVRNRDGRLAAALNPARFLEHVTLIHAWGTAHHDWNPIDWSLSAEWLAYLVFSVLLVVPLARLAAQVSSRALMLLGFIAVLPVVILGLGFQDGSDLIWNGAQIVGGMVPVRVLCEFVGGSIVALLFLRHGQVRLPLWVRPTVVLLVIVALLYLIQHYDPNRWLRFDQVWSYNGHLLWGSTETVVVVPLFLLLVGSLAASRRDPTTRFLASRVLVWGGKVSFALYMCHWLFLDIFIRSVQNLHVDGQPMGWGYRSTLLLVIAAAIGAAHLLYRFVEEPCRRVMRRMMPRSIEV
jgi:peptidoglycan/LPS O-acetylase OafA/YrhL